MSVEDYGVTLPEVNRNVVDLRRQIEGVATRYVPLVLWEEHRKYQGERIGQLEKEGVAFRSLVEKEFAALRAERAQAQQTFQTSFLYPVLLLLIGSGAGVLISRAFGGE